MSLEQALQTTMGTVPECIASGYVDMDTGMLLGMQTNDAHQQEVLDTLAAATADLLQGESVQQIEKIFKDSRNNQKDDQHYFQEMLIFSERFLHVFIRTKRYPAHVVCFVCRRNANPGMVLTKARMGLDAVSAAV